MHRIIPSALLVLFFVPAISLAQLYGVNSSSTPGTLYTLNTVTGAATPVNNLSGHNNGFPSIIGMDAIGTQLYVSDINVGGSAPQYRMGTLDRDTAVFADINNQGGSSNWLAMAGNPTANVLYVYDDDNISIKSVTTAGVITTIGEPGKKIGGMAYDNIHGILYGAALDGNLYRINPANAGLTLVGSLGGASFNTLTVGLAYDYVNDVLYLNNADTDSLYTVSTVNGAAALIGANGAVNGVGIDGLAFVPEPASSAVMLFASLVLSLRLSRRSR